MPFPAQCYQVLIASPSDLDDERLAAREAINDWNDLHAVAEGIVLLPQMWETHAAPESNVRPQESINVQFARNSDILVGMFWTRMGTDTGVAESGTVEEIDEFVESGKPAMLYFSNRLVDPRKIDMQQFARLREFKDKTYQHALTGGFATPGDLRHTLLRDLTRQVRRLKARGSEAPARTEQALAIASLLATHQREKEQIIEARDAALRRIEDLQRPGLRFFVADPSQPPYLDDDPFNRGQLIVRVGLCSTSVRTVRGVKVRIVKAIPDGVNVPRLLIDTEGILEIQGGTPQQGVDASDGHEIFPQLLTVFSQKPMVLPEVRINYASPQLAMMHGPLPNGRWLVTLIATGDDVAHARKNFTLAIDNQLDPRMRVSLRMEPDYED